MSLSKGLPFKMHPSKVIFADRGRKGERGRHKEQECRENSFSPRVKELHRLKGGLPAFEYRPETSRPYLRVPKVNESSVLQAR